jgi:hypothetical protein
MFLTVILYKKNEYIIKKYNFTFSNSFFLKRSGHDQKITFSNLHSLPIILRGASIKIIYYDQGFIFKHCHFFQNYFKNN